MFGETREQRHARLEAIRVALAGTELVSKEDRSALLSLGFQDFPRVISAHAGYRPHEKLASLQTARRHFALSCEALLGVLAEFHAFSGEPKFNHRDGEAQLEMLIDRIRKELFTLSTLAHSIQDHCRGVQAAWRAPEFTAKLAEHFGTDGLHEFVIKLRNALHHERMFEAHWELRWSATGEKSSHCNLDREELLADVQDWGAAKGWIERAEPQIDVAVFVTEYRRRSEAFYDWYLTWCGEHVPPTVEQYRDIRREQRAIATRASWKFFVRHFIDRGVDPREHLHKVLREDELERALALPPQSQELADFVIGCLDEDDACDDELRQMAYRLFSVPGASWKPAPAVAANF